MLNKNTILVRTRKASQKTFFVRSLMKYDIVLFCFLPLCSYVQYEIEYSFILVAVMVTVHGSKH